MSPSFVEHTWLIASQISLVRMFVPWCSALGSATSVLFISSSAIIISTPQSHDGSARPTHRARLSDFQIHSSSEPVRWHTRLRTASKEKAVLALAQLGRDPTLVPIQSRGATSAGSHWTPLGPYLASVVKIDPFPRSWCMGELWPRSSNPGSYYGDPNRIGLIRPNYVSPHYVLMQQGAIQVELQLSLSRGAGTIKHLCT